MAKKRKSKTPPGWDPVAQWYDGWVGKGGSEHHRQLALPAVLELLRPQPGEQVLDIGAGQGVLAPHIAEAGAKYTGVDVSPTLLEMARKHHGEQGWFLQGDARHLQRIPGLSRASFDAVVFLLSVQDIDPLHEAIEAAAWVLRDGGRAVILMTHPCFRVPRQSGWGFDDNRKLRYRRVDSYLSPLPVPMKAYGGPGGGVTISHHRPLSDYVNTLGAFGLLIDALEEIATHKAGRDKAERRANQEIPLFMGLRAVKRQMPDID